jgi:hypothetical protein
MSSLQKLATLRNIAIVLLNQSVTKMQSGAGAILVSAISSTAWDAGISTSIALFRDWGWEGKQVRNAKVLKADGIATGGKGGIGKVFAFTIESVCILLMGNSHTKLRNSANEITARPRGSCRYGSHP